MKQSTYQVPKRYSGSSSTRPSTEVKSPPSNRAVIRHEDMRAKLHEILSDRDIFIKSANGSFQQFDKDGNGKLSLPECRQCIERLVHNLALPQIDDHSMEALFQRFNTSGTSEMTREDFYIMYWQILWRVKEKHYKEREITLTRSNFVNRTAIREGEIKEIFEFEKHLGSGSFGAAHLVRERSSGIQRCCKTICKDKKKIELEQMHAEVQVLKTLDHPNVIKIVEVYEDYRNLYIIQDVCYGGVLYKRLQDAVAKKKVLTEKYVKEVMKQVLEALAYIHSKAVVHKDLKPDNIMYATPEPHSEIKVIDFGLSEMFTSQDDWSDMKAGTPLYMAPEVVKKHVTLKSDLWSAGVIMFQMLTGRLPFMAKTKPELEKKIQAAEPCYATQCRHVSREARELLQALLKKHPEHRPTALEALRHRWFSSNMSDSVQLDSEICRNLADFSKHSDLKATLINMLTHQLSFNTEQIRNLTEVFKKIDADNDGVISRDEMADAMGKAGLEIWAVNRILNAMDIDNSGNISYTEFLAAAYTWRESEMNVIWAAFRKLDKNNDGKISRQELRELLSGGGLDESRLMQSCKVDHLMQSIDRNGDGVIDWEEFSEYFTKNLE